MHFADWRPRLFRMRPSWKANVLYSRSSSVLCRGGREKRSYSPIYAEATRQGTARDPARNTSVRLLFDRQSRGWAPPFPARKAWVPGHGPMCGPSRRGWSCPSLSRPKAGWHLRHVVKPDDQAQIGACCIQSWWNMRNLLWKGWLGNS